MDAPTIGIDAMKKRVKLQTEEEEEETIDPDDMSDDMRTNPWGSSADVCFIY
jgi:hypothetical protein